MMRVVVLMALLLLLASKARADDARPWAAGVAPERQQAALALFEAGNALFTESQYAAALARYREALKLWSHPAIHYNAAVSLINLDQPLPAYEQLEAALAFGEAPLGTENHRQAELYKRLLSAQLAEVEVSCDEAGAELSLDGETLFRAPGSAVRRTTPGAHQLVARKPGFLTATRSLQLAPGKLTRERLKLEPIGAVRMRSVRRWSAWKPWAVLGGGVVLGLAGVALRLDAEDNLDTFDSEIARLCPAGCTESELPATVQDTKDRADTENAIAIGLFVAGGLATAAGVTLVILNQPRLEPDRPKAGFSLTPRLSARGGSVSASFVY
jgi:tetratricopeptide (TPR) repeat protein